MSYDLFNFLPARSNKWIFGESEVFRIRVRYEKLGLSCRGLARQMLHDLCALHAKLKSMLHKLQP